MMKRMLSGLLLAMLLCVSLLPATARAADSDFTIENGVLIKYNGKGGDVTIGNSVTSIGNSAFDDCDSLTSVTIGNSVTSIGDYAFNDCSSLTSVTIGNSVTSIGERAFAWCNRLTGIQVDAANPMYCSQDGVLFDKAKKTLIQCPGGKSGSYVIPSSVTSIGDYAFYDCDSLTGVTIGSSVTSIGDGAFKNCSSLTGVTIGNSVTSIGYRAFWYCSSLTDVYYTGSEAQWKGIAIGGYNDALTGAAIHYHSTMPIPDSLDFDESYTMTVGSTINISAMFTGNESPSGREVRWSSSDKAVYPAGETSFLAMQDTEPNIHWAYSRPVSASKAGTYTVTLKVGDLSATTQIVVTDPGAELRGELSTGGEIAFVLYPEPGSEAIGNTGTGTEGNPFLVTALIPGGASLTGDDDVQWFIYDSSADDPSIGRQIIDTLTMGEAGEAYSTVSGWMPKAGNRLRLHLRLSDGRSAWYYIESVAKKNEKVAKIQEFERPLYSVCFPTATRTFALFPGKQEELFMYVENQRFERLTGDERDKISSIVWESSNCHVVAFSEDGAGTITKEAAKKWGPWNLWGTDEDSVKLYAGDIPGAAKITCTVTVDGVQYQGSLDVTLLSYEAESLDAKVKQWVSAYEEYTKAVEKAMNKAAKAGGETASVEEIGIDLQAADESREEIDRMVHFNPGKKNPAISKLVYQALADYFSRYIPHNSDFSKIDVSKGITSTATSIVKEVAMSYRHINESYDSGVNLSGSGYGDAFYMFISYKGEQVATITGIKNAQKTMEAFLTSLVELDKNLINQAYKEALKEVFTTDLSHAILSGVKKKLTTALDQYAGVFFRFGAGNAAQMLKNCLDYYDYVKKISNAASYGASNPIQAVNAIKQIKFDYSTTSIRDAAVEASANKLKSAANGITEWLDKWSNGKPLPKAAIEVWKLVWSFQCPVNVAIFDSSGTQIGYVGEDDIWYDADRIYIENYGDEKQIYSNGEVLTFKAVGEDYGVMNCSFSEYDDGTPVCRVNYYDIPIEEGAEISILSTDGGIAENDLTVSTDDAVFSASEVIDAADYEDATVVIRCLLSDKNGGEVLGSGSHVRGDMVTLQAFSNEGYLFTGWMSSSGNLLSTSPIYEFTARENRTITAVFSEDIQIGESDNAVIYGVKAGKSSEGAYVIATAAPLSETTLNVYCAFYNEYGKMIDVQTKSVTEKEEIAFSGDNVEASMAKMFVLGEQYAPQ